MKPSPIHWDALMCDMDMYNPFAARMRGLIKRPGVMEERNTWGKFTVVSCVGRRRSHMCLATLAPGVTYVQPNHLGAEELV